MVCADMACITVHSTIAQIMATIYAGWLIAWGLVFKGIYGGRLPEHPADKIKTLVLKSPSSPFLILLAFSQLFILDSLGFSLVMLGVAPAAVQSTMLLLFVTAVLYGYSVVRIEK